MKAKFCAEYNFRNTIFYLAFANGTHRVIQRPSIPESPALSVEAHGDDCADSLWRHMADHMFNLPSSERLLTVVIGTAEIIVLADQVHFHIAERGPLGIFALRARQSDTPAILIQREAQYTHYFLRPMHLGGWTQLSE